jgi:hypothetical protein
MNTPTDKTRLAGLSLAAIGIVYGDIGTSPLYTLNTIFTGGLHPVPLNAENILGILSLIFWSLMIVVSFKYVAFIMRADNRGEGGIMALMVLALRKLDDTGKTRATVMLLGIFGAALFYGDGVITPAISVLSAVEGLQIASPALKTFVIPITIAVLWALFIFQRKGTARVGALFGPIMCAWFGVLAVLGVMSIVAEPHVLGALNPIHGYLFLKTSPWIGFLALGGVVLALTGAEALYADMGHFGRYPIQLAWFGLVLPALVLNYFGQGALLMHNPSAIANPFYLLAPHWALYPLVILSTVATVIASQAVISGAFSMTRQAMQLGYAPRMEMQQTSAHQLDSDACGAGVDPGVSYLNQPGGGVRHRCHRHHGDHLDSCLYRGTQTVGMGMDQRRLADHLSAEHRPCLFQCQHDQDRRGRLVSAGVRFWCISADDHLETWPPVAARQAATGCAGLAAVCQQHGCCIGYPGGRHSGVFDREPGRRTACPAA